MIMDFRTDESLDKNLNISTIGDERVVVFAALGQPEQGEANSAWRPVASCRRCHHAVAT
jgi:hypothetical protein